MKLWQRSYPPQLCHLLAKYLTSGGSGMCDSFRIVAQGRCTDISAQSLVKAALTRRRISGSDGTHCLASLRLTAQHTISDPNFEGRRSGASDKPSDNDARHGQTQRDVARHWYLSGLR